MINKCQVSSIKYQVYKSKIKVVTLLAFAFTGYWLLVTGYWSYAEPISSTELIEDAKELNGSRITYKGELVTAILNRGEYSWINLNDGKNAIGVWAKSSDLVDVKFVGDYKRKGDVLEIEGVFNRACPIHGGELDIHAEKIRFIEYGFWTKKRIDRKKINLSIAIFLLTLSTIAIFRKRI